MKAQVAARFQKARDHRDVLAGEGAVIGGLGRLIGKPLRGDAALPGLRRLRLLEVGGTEDPLAGHLGLHDAADVPRTPATAR